MDILTFPFFSATTLRRPKKTATKVSIRPPPAGFTYDDLLEGTQAAVSSTNPELMDLVEAGRLVVVPKDRFGPVPSWRSEFVEPESIWLVATSHISARSPVDVGRVVGAVRPDNVVVELCRSRAGGQSALALRLLLAIFSSKISDDANRPFGDEFRAARKAAEEVGAQIVLGDRPIEITLQRAWSSLTLSEKFKLLISLFRGITSPSSELSENNFKDQEMEGSAFQLYQQLGISYPSLLQPLIHERDTYLAWSLKRSKAVNNSARVVGIIGKGHLNGVIYALISDQGNLRFRDVAGKSSLDSSGGWVNSVVKSLVRDTIIGFILWALYEQLKITFHI